MTAFETSQFYLPIEEALSGLSISNTNYPNGDLDTTYGPIFSSYSASAGNQDLDGEYNDDCWVNNLPSLFGWSLALPAWHDTYNWPSAGPTSGHGVAITRRHVLVSEHGGESESNYLQWLKPDGTVVTAYPSGVRFQISASGWQSTPNPSNSSVFRLLYMNQDLPSEFVCPLLHPDDNPGLNSVPVVVFNKYREAVIWKIYQQGTSGNLGSEEPSDTQQKTLWRKAEGGDSGSPVFLAYQNDATRLAYLGHITAPSDEGPSGLYSVVGGPPYFQIHDKIIEAVEDLNDEFGGSYTPLYCPYNSNQR